MLSPFLRSASFREPRADRVHIISDRIHCLGEPVSRCVEAIAPIFSGHRVIQRDAAEIMGHRRQLRRRHLAACLRIGGRGKRIGVRAVAPFDRFCLIVAYMVAFATGRSLFRRWDIGTAFSRLLRC
jgi:hypothetical protein